MKSTEVILAVVMVLLFAVGALDKRLESKKRRK